MLSNSPLPFEVEPTHLRVNFLLRRCLLRRGGITWGVALSHDNILRMDGLGMLLAGDIPVDGLKSMRKCLPAFKDGEETNTEEGAEDPDNTHGDPAGEERFAEDIARAIHRHRPQNKECKSLELWVRYLLMER